MGRATDWYILNRHDDPTPGDLRVILGWEQYFADRQFDMDTALGRVSSLSGDLNTLNFVGDFATAVRDTMRDMATKLSWERDGYRRATNALQAYRLKLTPAQEHADAALTEGRSAYADHLNAQGMVTIHAQEIERGQKAQTSEAVKQSARQKTQQQGKADAAQSRLDAAISRAQEAGDSLIGPRKDLEAHLSEALDTLAYGILNAHYNGDLPKPPDAAARLAQARKDQGSLMDQILGIDPKDNPWDQFWENAEAQTDADVRAAIGAVPGVLDGATSITEAMTLMLLTDGLGPKGPKVALADGITVGSLDGVSTADIWAADKDGVTFDPVKKADQQWTLRKAQESGQKYEDYLSEKLEGEGSFKEGKREFDGEYDDESGQSTWYEAKSGQYWQLVQNDERKLLEFKSKLAESRKIAVAQGKGFRVISENPIPDEITQWLNKKGIPYTVIPKT